MSWAALSVDAWGQQTCAPISASPSFSSDALEEVTGVEVPRNEASCELLPFARESHLPSLASLSLGISAPCSDALWGVEEQELRNKLWSFVFSSLLYQLWYQPAIPTSVACAACVPPAGGIAPLSLKQHSVQNCPRSW